MSIQVYLMVNIGFSISFPYGKKASHELIDTARSVFNFFFFFGGERTILSLNNLPSISETGNRSIITPEKFGRISLTRKHEGGVNLG